MRQLNLRKIEDGKKITFTMYAYEEVLNELKAIADTTGITIQNLFRHSLNNTLDEFRKEGK
jgi:hypothetical protein